MALMSSYLLTTKNVEPFFNSLITAKAPETFTQKFLENLEFKSTNDRLYISLLKGLGFLDPNGTPTERYFAFLDQSKSKQVLVEAVKEAYGDLFATNIKANELSAQDVKNKLRTLTQGKNSDKVLSLMANTFRALVDYGEWSPVKKTDEKPVTSAIVGEKKEKEAMTTLATNDPDEGSMGAKLKGTQLHYNIQIHLPESRDQAVYDALFRSLRTHLF